MVACLKIEGTCTFLDTGTPSHRELGILTHLVLTPSYPWVPQNIKFLEFADYVQEEEEMRSIASVVSL